MYRLGREYKMQDHLALPMYWAFLVTGGDVACHRPGITVCLAEHSMSCMATAGVQNAEMLCDGPNMSSLKHYAGSSRSETFPFLHYLLRRPRMLYFSHQR